MRKITFLLSLLLTTCLSGQSDDWRLISNGQKIYEQGYCDQPYIVKTSDGTWICTFTTAPGHEGDKRQYIAATISVDQGKSWSDPVEIESASLGIEASWAMPLVTYFDRIYVFYTFNGDTIRQLPNGKPMRADTHGWYCFRYSDDKGKSWSERHRLPMRKTAVDRQNDFAGKVQMFWGIGKPVSKGQDAWFSFTKLGKYFLKKGEGWIYTSDNILTERAVSRLNWTLLPEGDIGIQHPDLGSVQEEFNLQPMNQANGLYCVYRTTQGQPAASYSFDKGKTWSIPSLISYANGAPLRNPRACPRLWKCKNGKYLLWYHNNGGKGFEHRNPAWVAGGVEVNGKITWSQPEILLYGPDRSYETGRFSYPDLVEEEGRYWVSTTQKTTATIHEIPSRFFEMLWSQFESPRLTTEGLLTSYDQLAGRKRLKLPKSLNNQQGGFALDCWIQIDRFQDAKLLKSEDAQNNKLSLSLRQDGRLSFTLRDANKTMSLLSDPGRLTTDTPHHVAILVDTDAQICYMLIDGSICDGGGEEVFGFTGLDSTLLDVEFTQLNVKRFPGKIQQLRIYGQQMFTSQMVSNYRAK